MRIELMHPLSSCNFGRFAHVKLFNCRYWSTGLYLKLGEELDDITHEIVHYKMCSNVGFVFATKFRD